MVKKTFLLALMFASPAFAGPQPPDVPAYVPMTPTYQSGTTPNVIGDGTTTGGTPPAAAYELAEVYPLADTTPYTIVQARTPGIITASISGTVMTVTAVASGAIRVGDIITGSGVTQTTVSSRGTGTGGVGTYNIAASQTVASESMQSNDFNYCTVDINGGPNSCTEAKFRSLINADTVKFGFDDPIRNYGQPGTAHLHMFFGNVSTNAFSTYASLRKHAYLNPTRYAQAAGRVINSTGYWIPAVEKINPFSDGKNYAVKASGQIILYYANNPLRSQHITRLLRGLRYVTNYNMDDPELTWLQKIVYNANAQTGTSGRYAMAVAADKAQWQCATTDGNGTLAVWDAVKNRTYLKTAAGGDPFNGHCRAGNKLWVQFNASAKCWDGVNLWSPDGYKHVIPQIHDNVVNDYVCPDGWYQIPGLILQIHFDAQQGPTDYMNWRLSSDDAAQAKLDSLPTCTTGFANAPCTTTSSPHVVLNGESIHTDWMNGWQNSILTQWLVNCIGIGNESGIPKQCDTSSVSPTLALAYSQVTSVASYPTTSAANMVQIGTIHGGPKTMHMNTH